MISQRTWRRLGLALLLLVLLGSAGHYAWQRLLDHQQIRELEMQGLRLTTTGIELATLSLTREDGSGRLQLDMHGLTLGWRDFSLSPPFWQHLHLNALAADWQSTADAPPADTPSTLTPSQLLGYLAWLPASLRIDTLSAALPCASGRCLLQGDLQLTRHSREPLDAALSLNLQHQGNQLSWHAQVNADASRLGTQLTLLVNRHPQLELHSTLQQDARHLQWDGTLAAPAFSEAGALQAWLREWALPATVRLPQAPGTARLMAHWQLQAPGTALALPELSTVTGEIAIDAHLPEPWPLPGIGRLQGQLSAAGRSDDGQWLAEQLAADLYLDNLPPELLDSVPATLRPDRVQLRIKPSEPPPELPEHLKDRALPLDVELTAEGPSEVALSTTVALANAAPWAAHLGEGRLTLNSKALALGSWKVQNAKADLRFSSYLDEQQASLDLNSGSRLTLGDLSGADLRLRQLDASTQGLRLTAQHQGAALQNWQVSGPLRATLQTLEQPALKPQAWTWQGTLEANETRRALNGELSNASDLQLAIQLQQDDQQGLQLKAQLAELFLRSGNPIAGTLNDWPALLDLNNGRLKATASLGLPPASNTPDVRLNLTATGVGGIYDRSELSGLTTQLSARLAPRALQLDIASLRLEEIDPGVPVGPLSLKGRYTAPRTALTQGTLTLDQAQLGVMNGQLHLAPAQWNLAEPDQLFDLQLRGLQLERLLTLYPAEGLAGSGQIDGQLPLRLDTNGVRIENGQIAARAPGGHLRFNSERIRALGRSNPAMQLVTQSLEDFRFTTLSSQVNYDRQGKLTLGMRLEGQNPAIEQGRPIHFNINLEEDIPTLLASLQLTDKVNDIIKQRVQQRMLERHAAPSPEAP